jgi:hypothetical protein
MKYLILIIIAFNACAQITFSQNPNDFSTKGLEKIETPTLTSFEQAAKWADLVAIVQVDDIEYKKVRNLNAEGYAYLKVRVAYKGAIHGESIAVVAKGFDDNICYYPDRSNEGERFLAFLKKAPDEKSNVYYGFKPYCQMQVLLSDIGQYILRTPLDDNSFSIDSELIESQNFNDPHAQFDTTLWTSTKRDEYVSQYQCKIIESEDTLQRYYHLRYTQGVPIYKIRPLLKIKHVPRITSKQK